MMRFKTGYWKRGAVKAQARTLEDKTVTEYEHEDMFTGTVKRRTQVTDRTEATSEP